MKLKIFRELLIFSASLALCIAGPVSDPCFVTTCGKGAECRVRSNLVTCVCPDFQEGDAFVECKPVITSTDLIPSSSSSSSFSAETTQPQNGFNASPNFNLSPKTERPRKNETFEDPNKVTDDPSSYFPSAPPTLSHYAHTPPFYQPSQSHSGHQPNPPSSSVSDTSPSSYLQQSNQLFSNNRNRNRPSHQSYQGTINHGFNADNDPGIKNNPVSHHQHATTASNPIVFDTPGNNRIQSQFERHPEQQHQHRHGGVATNKQPFSTQHEHHSHQHRVTPHLQNSYNNFQQHHAHSTNFNLKQDAQVPNKQELLALAKDPLGVYGDCRTINNRVVCADTSLTNEDSDAAAATKQRTPQVSGENHRFEHRHIAITNDNSNSFINSPPPREDAFINPAPKIKPVHTQPNHFRPAEHHHTGPAGTVNFYPSVNSAEVQPDSGKIIEQETSTQQQHQVFTETKPYVPQKGTEEDKMCQEMCGEAAVCRVFHNRPICGCPEGHTGDPSKKCYPEPSSKYDPNSCQRHTDCSQTMICANSQCTDPCLMKSTFDNPNISSFHYSLDSVPNANENMCGPNAICSVIEHTPVCGCKKNYFGNPYVGCVP